MIEVALVVSPGFQMMILAAMTAFEVANIASSESVYDIWGPSSALRKS
jgi:hypothetical protein